MKNSKYYSKNLSVYKHKSTSELLTEMSKTVTTFKKTKSKTTEKKIKFLADEISKRQLSFPQSEIFDKLIPRFYIEVYKLK